MKLHQFSPFNDKAIILPATALQVGPCFADKCSFTLLRALCKPKCKRFSGICYTFSAGKSGSYINQINRKYPLNCTKLVCDNFRAVMVVINPSKYSGYCIRPPALTSRKHTALNPHSVSTFLTILTENIW